MELSICIPIYQQAVHALVQELVCQAELLDLTYEICLLDDNSNKPIRIKNRTVSLLSPNVRYQELPQNVGRSKIRNKLAKMANGKWLIFLDCDVTIKQSNFLKNYWLAKENSVQYIFCGGCQYTPTAKQKGHELRYIYGKQVEEIRQQNNQWISPFLTGNFMIWQGVFEQIQFDETITKYGYEDLLFSLHFEEKFNQEIKIINNPIAITQVDISQDYLLKTKTGVQNLAKLYLDKKVFLKNNIRLLIAYHQLKQKGLTNSLHKIGKNSLPLLLFNLTSSSPNLKLFQFYKLIHFIDEIENNKKHTN